MTFFDILIAIVLGYNLINGFRTGAIKILGKTAALIICFNFSKKNYLVVEPTLKAIFNIHPKIQNILNFGTTFLLSYIFALFILQILFKFLKIVHEGAFDHILGAILGLIKGIIIILLITIPMLILNVNWITNSFIITQTEPLLTFLMGLMKKSNYFNQFLDILNLSKKTS